MATRANELTGIISDLKSVVPADSGIDIEAIAREDIARQTGEAAAPSPGEMESSFMSYVTGQTGAGKIGEYTITGVPEIDERNYTNLNSNAQMSLRNAYMGQKTVPVREVGQPVGPFFGPEYKKVRLSPKLAALPEDQRNAVIEVIENRQNVARIFSENKYQLPQVTQDIFLDAFATGDLSTEFGKAFRNIPADFARMPTLGAMAVNAATAGVQAITSDDEEDALDTPLGERFSQLFQEKMQGWGDATRWYENYLNKVDFLDSAATDVQQWYKGQFYAQYEDKDVADAAWRASHQRVKTRIVRPEDPDYDSEEAKFQGAEGMPYVSEFDENGNTVYEDVPLPVEMVGELIDLAYRDLAASEKFAVFAGTTIPLTLGLSANSVTKGLLSARKIQRVRRESPGAYRKQNGAAMSDWEVWKSLKKESPGLMKAFRATWHLATVGAFRVNKGNVNMGTQLSRHLETLAGYDDRIEQLNRFKTMPFTIDPGAAAEVKAFSSKARQYMSVIEDQAAPMTQVREARRNLAEMFDAELASTKKALNSYVRGSTTVGFRVPGATVINNPYTRNLVADDVIISTAIALSPEVVPYVWSGVEKDTVETFSMLMSPMLAPGLFRGTTKLAVNIPVGGPVIKDMANLFANVPLVGIFARNIAEGRDMAQLRKTLENEGMTVTDETVRSYHAFKQIYSNLKPEFRDRVDRAFENYGETMDGIEMNMRNSLDQGGNRVFSDEDIDETMNALHLSLAQASGLSPLIAIQQSYGGSLTPGMMLDDKKMDTVLDAMTAEEDTYASLGRIQEVISKKIQGKSGVNPELNDQLQKFLEESAQLIQQGEDGLSFKRQELNRHLRNFSKGAMTDIDDQTVDKIVELKTLLLPKELRATVDEARLVQETAVEVMEGARQQARGLAGASANMADSEVVQAARSIADTLFDAEMGTKYALGKIEYRKIDKYTADKGAFIDLRSVAEQLMNVASDFEGREFKYLFGGGSEFFEGMGGRAQRAFESAARRGLSDVYADDLGEMMAAGGYKNFTEAALDLFQGDDAATAFKATVSETEDLYRAFRDFEATKKGISSSGAVDKKFSRIVDEVYKKTDPELSTMIGTARSRWQEAVGYQTDINTLGGDAQRSLVRRNVKDMRPGEGKHRYRSVSKAPHAPFVRISNDIVKYINEPNVAKRDEIMGRIVEQRDRIMYFAGGATFTKETKGGEYGFDVSSAQRRRNADTVSTLLETLVAKKLALSYEGQITAAMDVAQTLGRPITREEAIKRIATKGDYDFGRAARLTEVENALRVPIQDGADASTYNRRPLLQSTNIQGWTRNFDELFEADANVRQKFNDIRDEINDQGSELNIAARDEIQRSQKILGTDETFTGLIKDPAKFFDVVFENANARSIENVVESFVRQGMDEIEVRRSLAYMYQRGFFEKMGTQVEFPHGAQKTITTLREPQMLADYVYTERKAEVMRAVLGDEHFEDMKLFADYSRMVIGDGAGFRSAPDIRAMSLDSMFSRVFNIARGLVSIPYVATEVTGRMMLLRKQKMLRLAMSDRQAAEILAKIVKNPDEINRADLELLTLRTKIYLAKGIFESGGEIPALDEILGEDATKRQELLVEEADIRQEGRETGRQSELLQLQDELRELTAIDFRARTGDQKNRIKQIQDRIKEIVTESRRDPENPPSPLQ